MALSYFFYTDADTGSNSNTLQSSSFTPQNSSLLVVIAPAWCRGTRTLATSITDSVGLTWTKHVFREDAPNGNGGAFATHVSIWTAPVTTGTSMTVTVNFGEPDNADTSNSGGQNIYVVGFTGHDTTTPVRQTFGDGRTTAYFAAYTGTLSSAPLSTSYVLSGEIVDNTPAIASDIATGSGYTQIGTKYEHNYTIGHAQRRTSSTSTDLNLATVEAEFSWSIAAVEVQESSGSTPVTVNVTGNSSTASVGDESVVAKATISVTGNSATASVGTVDTTCAAIILVTGQAITTDVGTASVAQSANVSITGQSITASVGVVEISLPSLTGMQMTCSVGTALCTGWNVINF